MVIISRTSGYQPNQWLLSAEPVVISRTSGYYQPNQWLLSAEPVVIISRTSGYYQPNQWLLSAEPVVIISRTSGYQPNQWLLSAEPVVIISRTSGYYQPNQWLSSAEPVVVLTVWCPLSYTDPTPRELTTCHRALHVHTPSTFLYRCSGVLSWSHVINKTRLLLRVITIKLPILSQLQDNLTIRTI